MSDSSTGTGKRPPRQARTGTTGTGARKAASKSVRSRSREFALQGLYQHLVGGNAAGDIDPSRGTWPGFTRPTPPTTTRCCTAVSSSRLNWTR
jgi:N utilization substance protein B